MNFKKLHAFYAYISLLLCSQLYASECIVQGGGIYPYNFSYSLTSSTNHVGTTTSWDTQTSSGSYYWSTESCNTVQPISYSGRAADGFVLAETEADGTVWYDIPGNDYVQIAIKIGVYNQRTGSTPLHNVPFTDISNNCNNACRGSISTGSTVALKARLKKQLIGESYFSLPVAYLYASQPFIESFTRPVVAINISGYGYVPQSCTFDVGDVIEFDFGIIKASAFSKGGAMNIPENVNKMEKTAIMSCKNIDGGSLLTMSVEAHNFESNYIKSSNVDVGFQVSDINNYIFIPNDNSSLIPFQLDEDAKARISLKAWPISLTGQKPISGPVTGEGYLRIDYQ
jgi:minor fimbrial subunit